jgi:hypothetical protein|tara:strand:+ start:487 stop:975 length:489 start_codon:yes stop_codon:yes gene_type:complete
MLVANSDRESSTGAAMLGIYDLGSGEQLAMVDLSGSNEDPTVDANYFANDVAVSAAGAAFVTDTRMSLIYKVGRYYRASVLIDFGRESGFNRNGIEYNPEGYLIAVSTSNKTGSVMKYASDDHWMSSRLTGMASFEGQATTAAAVGSEIFVVQPILGTQIHR